jgi:hypothetical protein
MHARVSPAPCSSTTSRSPGMAPRALECAEELRINTLIARSGFRRRRCCATDPRRTAPDASPKVATGPRRICFLMAVLGTGGEKQYLAGIRSRSSRRGCRDCAPCAKRALALMNTLASAVPRRPHGLNDEAVAQWLRGRHRRARAPPHAVDGRATARRPRRNVTFVSSLARAGRSASADREVRVSAIRRHRDDVAACREAQACVAHVRARAARPCAIRAGCSPTIEGGPSLDVRRVTAASWSSISPGRWTSTRRRSRRYFVARPTHSSSATAIAPVTTESTPNVWILADRGSVATRIPSGNIGNGVDGPVLEWVLAPPTERRADRLGHRRSGHRLPRPSGRRPHRPLRRTGQVATAIRLVKDLAGAGVALGSGRTTTRSQWSQFGRLGRKLQEMTAF